MTLETAVRMAEMMMAFAYFLQSIEWLSGLAPEKTLGFIRAILSIILFLGYQPLWVEAGLIIIALILLHRFDGPYNGGSDCMSMLILFCLFLSHALPHGLAEEMPLSYLSFQLIYSYFQSGYIKLINPAWRNGSALCDVFAFTAYPVSEQTRAFAQHPRLMCAMAWGVMLFEFLFPLALFQHLALCMAFLIALGFHLANAYLFGLNRFFWIWPAAYPIVFWFQENIIFHSTHMISA